MRNIWEGRTVTLIPGATVRVVNHEDNTSDLVTVAEGFTPRLRVAAAIALGNGGSELLLEEMGWEGSTTTYAHSSQVVEVAA